MGHLWTGNLGVREALNLIDRLPRGSHYSAALADDDDLADLIDEDGPAPKPPLTDWSADHAMLNVIADRLGELLHLTAAANSGKKQAPYKPLPRPETALQRKARRRRAYKHQLINERLAQAATSGRPTMADVAADSAHIAARPRRKG